MDLVTWDEILLVGDILVYNGERRNDEKVMMVLLVLLGDCLRVKYQPSLALLLWALFETRERWPVWVLGRHLWFE
jgi:hypothetical protein